MRTRIISLGLFLAASAALAQTGPSSGEQATAEVIENRLPGVFSISVEIDPRLAAYPAVMNAVRSSELTIAADFAEQALEDRRELLEIAPDRSWNAYFRDTVITVTFADTAVVSLSRSISHYTGGAHPNLSLRPVVIRTGDMEPAGLEDLIADTDPESPGLTALFYAVYRELMAMKRVRLGAGFDESMERETWLSPLAAELEAFPGFTLIPDTQGDAAGGLMFHFDPYAVGSYAEGGYEVPVPLSVFEDYLTDEWAQVFDGAPSQSVLTQAGDALEPVIPAREE